MLPRFFMGPTFYFKHQGHGDDWIAYSPDTFSGWTASDYPDEIAVEVVRKYYFGLEPTSPIFGSGPEIYRVRDVVEVKGPEGVQRFTVRASRSIMFWAED